eukprot:NODE_1892_length_1366_cov_3.466970_g1713_i0.p1 GENE.NODE_1892_length_1366_cov_3.466970_g1713_i0~~NODE_1892_length_1366_cov_3.466970_g1713_i0.p1  ORF type:complete len:386 (-),score=92.20 NODE_1892_length_1366_cov_3.466970_g1713_i0:136-1293(-)
MLGRSALVRCTRNSSKRLVSLREGLSAETDLVLRLQRLDLQRRQNSELRRLKVQELHLETEQRRCRLQLGLIADGDPSAGAAEAEIAQPTQVQAGDDDSLADLEQKLRAQHQVKKRLQVEAAATQRDFERWRTTFLQLRADMVSQQVPPRDSPEHERYVTATRQLQENEVEAETKMRTARESMHEIDGKIQAAADACATIESELEQLRAGQRSVESSAVGARTERVEDFTARRAELQSKLKEIEAQQEEMQRERAVVLTRHRTEWETWAGYEECRREAEQVRFLMASTPWVFAAILVLLWYFRSRLQFRALQRELASVRSTLGLLESSNAQLLSEIQAVRHTLRDVGDEVGAARDLGQRRQREQQEKAVSDSSKKKRRWWLLWLL